MLLYAVHIQQRPAAKTEDFREYKMKASLSCGPQDNQSEPTPNQEEKYIVALPGWGHYGYAISTQSDSAQWYFNQGLNMYYSYHLLESRASFREAARFDSACAMTWWGLALSYGPSYNFSFRHKMKPQVLDILQHMNNSAAVTSKEHLLVRQ